MYELLDHTADVKLRAESDSLGGCFEEAVKAFSEIVTEGEKYEPTKLVKMDIESENLEALVFDFIDRLIYIQDVEGIVLTGESDIEIQENEEFALDAELEATDIDDKPLLDLKGPTYNDMKIEEKKAGWMIEAVIDI